MCFDLKNGGSLDKGQLLLRQGYDEAAEDLSRKALCIAQEQEAKLWELRAVVSLARLQPDQGRTAKPATCSRRSTAGSPKGSSRLTSKRRRHCSTNWIKDSSSRVKHRHPQIGAAAISIVPGPHAPALRARGGIFGAQDGRAR